MGVKKNSGRYPMEETNTVEKVDPKYYSKLRELAAVIKDDYIWANKSKTILDNNGLLGDIDTKAFLNGVLFSTKHYLDILDKLKEE